MKYSLFDRGGQSNPKIMKKSKLDPYRDFIVERLPSKNICKIVRELAEVGCIVRRSTLTKWLEKLGMAEKIEIPHWERGRPKNIQPAIFRFLPEANEPDRRMELPFFFVAMQTLPQNLLHLSRYYRMQRNIALAALGLPEGANTDIQQWAEVERFAQLSDVELCLLALLRSNLTPPPFTAEGKEMTRWFNELAALASNLRTEIREACKARKS